MHKLLLLHRLEVRFFSPNIVTLTSLLVLAEWVLQPNLPPFGWVCLSSRAQR